VSKVFAADDQKRRTVETHSRQAEEFASSYEGLVREPYQSCFNYSRHRLQGWLEHMVPRGRPGALALDVGCGTGYHLRWLAERGFDTVGLDASAEMLAHARRTAPRAKVLCGDVDALPFSNGSFDLVFCIEVIRYLRDASTCLSEIARVLRPGGACVLTAAPRLNLNGYWLVNRVAGLVALPGFVRLQQFFTSGRALRRLLRRAGLDGVDVHGVYLGPINWVERLAPPLLPGLLRRWEGPDARLADLAWARDLSNMYVVRAIRGGDA